MDACKLFKFSPERSITLRNIDSGVGMSDVQEVLNSVGVISKLQKLPDFILCEFEEVLPDKWLENEHPSPIGQTWIMEPVVTQPMKLPNKSSDTSIVNKHRALEDILLDVTSCFQEQLSEIAEQYGVDEQGLEQRASKMLYSDKTEELEKVDKCRVVFDITNDEPIYRVPSRSLDTPKVTRKSSTFLQSTPITTPADIQRVVVEHVVNTANEYKVNSSNYKVKSFSGATSMDNEAEYEIWRLQIRQVVNDSDLTESAKKRKLLESLLPPALNVALCTGDKASAAECFEELEKAYGSVEKGDELFFQFIETHQVPTEKASEYFSRLYALLQRVIERGGLDGRHPNQQLVKQFIRGCWDDTLIERLHVRDLAHALASKRVNYTDLLSQVRAYEKERETKELRKKRYHSNVQVKASNKVLAVPENTFEKYLHPESALRENNLSQRIQRLEESMKEAELHSMLRKETTPTLQAQCNLAKRDTVEKTQRPEGEAQRKNKFFYCYNCGEDGHTMGKCSNAPNAELVQQKLKRRWEKRGSQRKAASCTPPSLN